MEKNGNRLLDEKKNAFTLIELLAVIIILAVVALVATPVILNVVDNTRKKAFEQSANGYYNAARYIYDEMLLNGNTQDITFTFENGEQSSSNANYQLQVKGEAPKNGIIHLSSTGEVLVSINNDKWCAQTEENEVRISEDTTNCGYTAIPEECWEIGKEPLYNSSGSLDGSEEWMIAEHNMLYYTQAAECPLEIDTLKIPSEINGEKVEGIANWTLSGLPITNVIIPSSVEYIDEGAFYGGVTKNVILSKNLKYIGCMAFSTNNLTHISLPQSLLYIDVEAFISNQLTSVKIPDSVTTIGSHAFAENLLTNIDILSSVTSIGAAAFNNNRLPDDQAFIYKRNVDGTEDKTTIVSYGGAKRKNVIIPDGVTSISMDAFFWNQLTSVVIPNSVTSIGNRAFYNNQLTSVKIPNSVTIIEGNAFANNKFPNANAITIEGDSTRFDTQWASIGFPAK